jgi:glycosyltransferase involved in cell wall biosynthesis
MTSPKKIAHVSTVHRWNDTRILHKMCASLARFGYEVDLIAPADGDFSSNGVQIHGLRQSSARPSRILLGPWRAFRAIRRLQPDLVHMHDPELLPLALILEGLGYKVIFDSHEDYPRDFLVKTWLPALLRTPLSLTVALLNQIASRVLSGIVCASPAIARGFGSNRSVIIYNYPDIEEFAFVDSRPFAQRPPAFAYVGDITLLRGVKIMVQAMRLLRERHPTAILELAGNFETRDLRVDIEQSAGWEGVRHHGWLDRKAVGDLLGKVCAGLMVLAPTPTFRESIAIKMFEYMAAGLPVIASDFSLWRSIIERHKCGLLVDPTNPYEVADTMNWVLSHPEEAQAMGSRGRRAVMAEYRWSVEEQRLLALYDSILGQGGFNT